MRSGNAPLARATTGTATRLGPSSRRRRWVAPSGNSSLLSLSKESRTSTGAPVSLRMVRGMSPSRDVSVTVSSSVMATSAVRSAMAWLTERR